MSSNERDIFLTTANLDLVLINTSDASQILKWFRDPEVSQYLNGGEFPITLEHEEEYISEMYKGDKKLQLGIYHRQNKKLIGTVGIHKINNTHLEGSYGIAIGEKDYWGKGYGTETLKTMLEWAFYQKGLHTITLNVHSNNPRGRKCYEKCGFTYVGTISKSVFKQGVWVDRHIMMIKNPLFG